MFTSIHTLKSKCYQCLFCFLKSITGNTPLELAAPRRKTQTSDYYINKLWHFAAKHIQYKFFLRCLDLSLDFSCNPKTYRNLIMSPKSHSMDTRTSLIALL